MSLWPEGPLLPLLALIWPLALGLAVAAPPMRAHALRLLPLAPLPALALALAGPGTEVTFLSHVLLGVTLGMDATGALLLGTTAAIWLAAGIHAQGYMRDTPRAAVFAGFWCLTLAGNLGVFLAHDVITFYVAFAAVSLAAYFLVVHDGTARALRAGRIYIILAVLGETCLLAGFTIGAAAAESLIIADIRVALPEAPLAGAALWLLVAGFGLKAGLMPLHVWLPIAHPAAPAPASAVLSGAIVTAGIIGLILFLPGDRSMAAILLAAGMFTAFAAALLGLTQVDPKAVLAYSTVSQMGLVIALIGAARNAGAGTEQAAFYAAHHGLAKGALFLSAGLVATARGGWRLAALGVAALAALSVAGAPLSGGALAKSAAKPGLEPMVATAFALSAVVTTLLLAWFLYRLARQGAPQRPARSPSWMLLPSVALTVAAWGLPWILWQGWAGELSSDYPFRLPTLWAGFWPVIAGLALAALAVRLAHRMPRLPEGDIATAFEVRLTALASQLQEATPQDRQTAGMTEAPAGLAQHVGRLAQHIEIGLRRWRWSGLAILVLALAIGGALAM